MRLQGLVCGRHAGCAAHFKGQALPMTERMPCSLRVPWISAGLNGYGQLGDNTTTNQRAPVAVADPGNFAQVSAGGGHTCAVRSNGRLACWGEAWQGGAGVLEGVCCV